MSGTAIRLEDVSKRYVIGIGKASGDGLRHTIERAIRAPLASLRSAGLGRNGNASEEFWALDGVSATIQAGEVVGIIGRNGAGKSTLLKILSRITDPTRGKIQLRGRVASLLEVGTGFHAELTGRENIFLNGAILGMSRVEIRQKFDEIVAFSGVEKFINTPVKRYSSGMYVRLAFAVAAHLDPEILIVDEVLAVGDAEFQKKCLDKMDDVRLTGRTILFVSHNMQAITRLCSRCLYLEKGKVRMDGNPERVAAAYLGSGRNTNAVQTWDDLTTAPGDEAVRVRGVTVRTETGDIAETFDIRQPIGIEIDFEVLQDGHVFHPHFSLRNEAGVLLFVAQDLDEEWRRRKRPRGRYISTGWVPGNLLAEGAMTVCATIMTLNPEAIRADMLDVVLFQVVDCLTADDTSRGDYPRPIPGAMRPSLRWTTVYTPAGGQARRDEEPAFSVVE
jgi:lipopolysaccharide transport system ATP-binding protein